MIKSKYIARITAAVMVLSLLACGFFVYAANNFEWTKTTEYQRKMFGDEMVVIDIQVDAAEWDANMSNAQAKEWISADVVINGKRFGSVGIRTKGNSSLGMMGGSSGSYSLSFKSNKYSKGQTFFGLDSFCVNNMVGDATYMKDYIAYDIMRTIGVDAPLTNYAKVTVNGEDYGFGIMIERYDEAYLERVHSTSAGELYSVKIGGGMGGGAGGFNRDDFINLFDSNVVNEMPQRQQRTQGGGGFGGGMGRGGMGGGSLVYTDSNPESYNSIFSNSVKSPDKISERDKQKVVTALENLNNGTNLEKYIDVDATLRYFAAHTVVVNNDSYTSNMAQNYYLYERNGKLTILPWDYNLSFGGMGGQRDVASNGGSVSGASSIVNFPIDTPVSGVSIEDRPLLNKLLEVDEYREQYHAYLNQIVEGYFESGLYEETVRSLDAKINEYVKNDVSASYTYEQYESSLTEFIELLRLRGESIKGQLDGTIPSTSAGQNADSSTLIATTTVNLTALGSMGGGGGMGGERPQGGMGEERPQGGMTPPEGWEGFPGGMEGFPEGEMPDRGGMGGERPQGGFPGGEMPQQPGGTDESGGMSDTTKGAIFVGVLVLVLITAIVLVARKSNNVV